MFAMLVKLISFGTFRRSYRPCCRLRPGTPWSLVPSTFSPIPEPSGCVTHLTMPFVAVPFSLERHLRTLPKPSDANAGELLRCSCRVAVSFERVISLQMCGFHYLYLSARGYTETVWKEQTAHGARSFGCESLTDLGMQDVPSRAPHADTYLKKARSTKVGLTSQCGWVGHLHARNIFPDHLLERTCVLRARQVTDGCIRVLNTTSVRIVWSPSWRQRRPVRHTQLY